MDFPQKTEQKKIGERGSSKLRDFFITKGWNYRSQEDQNDFGVDGESEVVIGNNVLGVIFKTQVKGAASLDWKKDFEEVYVKKSTYNYWSTFNIPLVAFLVDLKTSEIFWSLPAQQTLRETNDNMVVTFERKHELNKSFADLVDFIFSWHIHFSSDSSIEDTPRFHKIFLELLDYPDWGDKTSDVGEEVDMQFRIFYRHLQQLRLVTGLIAPSLIPLRDWYARNYAFVKDDLILSHAVLTEAVLYSKGFYIEALLKLKDRLSKVQFDSKYRTAYEYLNEIDDFTDKKLPQGSFSVIDSRCDDVEFHNAIESKLKKADALRFCFSKKEVY